MSFFPVTSSNLSPAHLASFLVQEYQLHLPVSCKLLKTGISHTYLVSSDSQKYIFRIYSLNWRTEQEITEEIRLINHLKDHGIPVSYPLCDPSGTYIKTLNAPEGKRFGVMFSHADGSKALHYSEEVHYKVGETLARIHQLTEQFPLNRTTYTPDVLLDQSFDQLKLFLDPGKEEMIYMASLKGVLTDFLQHTGQSNIRFGAIHTDIWFDNMHITENGEITLFDFDFCGNGFLVQDLGYYMAQLYQLEREETQYNSKLDRFLAGYESIAQLSDYEKEAIPYLGAAVYFFFLGVQCQRYDNWSNAFVNEIYLSRFINMIIKKWCIHHQILA